MGILQKLMLAWKGRAVIAELSQISKGWKTPAFWVSLLGAAITYLGALKGLIPGEYMLIISTGLACFYNILRGAQKMDAPGVRPWYKTTEFWLGAGTAVSNALVALKAGGVGPMELTQANTILLGAVAIGRDLSNQQPGDGSVPLAAPASTETKPQA